MLEIATHLRQLDYYTRPDYLLIYKKFDEIMKAGKFKWSDPYDWEKPSATGTLTKKILRTLSVSEEVEDVKEDEKMSVEQPLLSEDTEITTKKEQKTKRSMMQPPTTTTDKQATAKEFKENDWFTIADFEKNEIGF
uniref:Uncharacterized protein n=1 Tax=Panagrolaimus sp. PS1159 TaxID=55785 RepID=A0AC35FKS6_9BILA